MNNYLRILIVFSFWNILFSAIQFWIIIEFNNDTLKALYDSVISNTIITVISFALFYISKNIHLQAFHFIKPIAILGAGVFGSYYLQKTIISLVVNDTNYDQFVSQGYKLRLVFNFLTINSAGLISFIWNYKTNKQAEQAQLSENEKLLKEAELLNLRQQIQPHFLFNSLNSISALLVIKPNLAQKMIQELADFLRGTLKKDSNALVSLQSEINHLQLYLNIEMVRFEHRLLIDYQIEESTKELLLPSLLLQPIVENAIKFGLYGTTDKITINISSKKFHEMLLIEVTNPFDQDATTQNKGAGFGLNSIARRLYLLYARHDLLKISTLQNTFTTQILIPQTVSYESNNN